MSITTTRALAALIGISTLLRIVWAATLETGNDEAYHYLFTINPDWSFFDHPPMTMVVAKLSIALCGGWVHPLSLRLGFILLFAGSTWVLARWTSRWYGEYAGFCAALALNLTGYYTAAGAFAVPDGPFLFFSLLTFWAISEAVIAQPDRVWPWLWVGAAWAGACLSKYHAVLLPLATLIYIVITPGARRLLISRGPYLALIIGILGFAPVVVWNAQNEWASFAFQGARAVGLQFRRAGLLVWLFGPMLFFMPWIWFAVVGEVVTRFRRVSSLREIDRLILCLGLTPIFFFLPIACVREMLPHWPLIGFVALLPLVGLKWTELVRNYPRLMRLGWAAMAVDCIVLTGLFAIQARLGLFDVPIKDPCVEIAGWESVAKELSDRGILAKPNSFIFTSHWFQSGQLAFALRNEVPVLCYSNGDARGFAFWSEPDRWLGADGYLIQVDEGDSHANVYQPYFDKIELVATFSMTRGERHFRDVRVYRCERQKTAFPFVYTNAKRNTSIASN